MENTKQNNDEINIIVKEKKPTSEAMKKAKAYELWEKDGRKQGDDLHYWLQAKKTVEAHAKK